MKAGFHRVSGEQGVDLAGEADSIAGLAAGSRAKDADQVDFSGEIFVKDLPDIYFFSRREFRHRGNGCERFLCHSDAKIAFYDAFEKKALTLQSLIAFVRIPEQPMYQKLQVFWHITCRKL